MNYFKYTGCESVHTPEGREMSLRLPPQTVITDPVKLWGVYRDVVGSLKALLIRLCGMKISSRHELLPVG